MIKIEDTKEKNEIDLIDWVRQVWHKKMTIIYSSIVMVGFGVGVALIIPNTFTSGVIFIPHVSGSSLTAPDGLSGLASLAGIDLTSSSKSAEIPPSLYPRIVESLPFRQQLLKLNINVHDSTYMLSDYLLKKEVSPSVLGLISKYTIGLPMLIFDSSKEIEVTNEGDQEIYMLTKDDVVLFEHLTSQLTLALYEKEGFVGLSFSDHDRYVSAQVAKEATHLLQERIIDYRNQASKELLNFALRQYESQKSQFNVLQDSFALYRDRNQNFSTAFGQIQMDRLSREISIVTSVLEQLASQLEQAKLQVNKDTPVFMIIEPVSVPFKKTAPKRLLIVLIFGFLGLVFSSGFVILSNPLRELISEVKGKTS